MTLRLSAREHAALTGGTVAKRSKWRAKRTTVDGNQFHSQAEAKQFIWLKLRERAGLISDIRVQVLFVLHAVNQWTGEVVTIGKHLVDFQYFEEATGEYKYREVKGFDVPFGKWKRRHCETEYGITIEVVD